ncbi:hypothetical protein LZ31DRAFT_103069 [Colletotrichum somersetense]|nr:hypothetical protein LZ31DRAFT_103069 [Colletotrichum somersetense]
MWFWTRALPLPLPSAPFRQPARASSVSLMVRLRTGSRSWKHSESIICPVPHTILTIHSHGSTVKVSYARYLNAHRIPPQRHDK